jgi:hypothetical protein
MRHLLTTAALMLSGFLFCLPALQAAPSPTQVIEWLDSGQLQRLTDGAFSFVQMTDTHINPRTEPPDVAAPAATLAALREAVSLYPAAAFVVFTGDNGPRFFEEIVSKSPLPAYVVNGNRSTLVRGREVESVSRSDFISWPWTGEHLSDMKLSIVADDQVSNAYGPIWYRRDYGDNVFLFLQTHAPDHEGAIRPDQLGWLHRQLSAFGGRNVFILSHHAAHLLMNHDFLIDLLLHHRPRQRSLLHLFGHGHMLSRQEINDVHIIQTPNMNSLLRPYRLVHVLDDCIVTYVRLSETAQKQDAAAAGQEDILPGARNVPGWAGRLSRAGLMTGSVQVIPLRDLDEPPPQAQNASPWSGFADWAGNRESDAPDVLNIIFDRRHEKDLEFRLMDRSPAGNDTYINSLFFSGLSHSWSSYRQDYLPSYGIRLMSTPEADSRVWLEKDGKGAIVCGHPSGAGGMFAWDSYSLNTPALNNALTLEAVIYVPEQPVGFAYHIADKGYFSLDFREDGRIAFSLLLRRGEELRSQNISLELPEALEPGRWHRLAGIYDGSAMRLKLNGQVLAERDDLQGSRLAFFRQSLYVNGSSIWAMRRVEGCKPFLLHSLRLSNRVAGQP